MTCGAEAFGVVILIFLACGLGAMLLYMWLTPQNDFQKVDERVRQDRLKRETQEAQIRYVDRPVYIRDKLSNDTIFISALCLLQFKKEYGSITEEGINIGTSCEKALQELSGINNVAVNEAQKIFKNKS